MKQAAGFTLMEILVAMVLLAGLGIAALSSFSSVAKATTGQQGVAYNFARGQVEKMFEYVRQDLWPLNSQPLSVVTPGPQGTATTLNGKTFTANYTVTSMDPNGDAQEDYRRVTVDVSW